MSNLDNDFRGLLNSAVVSANAFRLELQAGVSDEQRYKMVRKHVADNDLVVAVWKDSTANDGVGWLLIKGQQRLRELIADGEKRASRLAGIPCIDAGQAFALLDDAGEADRRH